MMISNSEQYDFNDLVSDLAHLSTLIGVTTEQAIDIIDPSREQCDQTKAAINKLSDLLWIARDMAEEIAKRSEDVHRSTIAAMKAAKAPA